MFALKEKIQNSLFQHIRERVCDSSISRASLRFANILLLLPSVAKVAAIYYENAQLTKMFGRYSLDPFLAEIFLDLSQNQVSSSEQNSCYNSGVGKTSANVLNLTNNIYFNNCNRLFF